MVIGLPVGKHREYIGNTCWPLWENWHDEGLTAFDPCPIVDTRSYIEALAASTPEDVREVCLALLA